MNRAHARFQSKGRFVPYGYIVEEVDALPQDNFQEIKDHENVTSYQRYSNDVPYGTLPVLLEEGGNLDVRLASLLTQDRPGEGVGQIRREPAGVERGRPQSPGGTGVAALAPRQSDLFGEEPGPDVEQGDLLEGRPSEILWNNGLFNPRTRGANTVGALQAAVSEDGTFRPGDLQGGRGFAQILEDELGYTREGANESWAPPDPETGRRVKAAFERLDPNSREPLYRQARAGFQSAFSRGGPEGVTAAEDRARAIVSSLEGKVQRGAATQAETRRYNEARRLLRRMEGMDAQEVQARLSELEEGDRVARDPLVQDLFDGPVDEEHDSPLLPGWTKESSGTRPLTMTSRPSEAIPESAEFTMTTEAA